MAADFEEEGRLAHETVTRQSSNPNVMLGGVAVLAAAIVIGLMWYASLRKQTKPQNAGEESFATARLQPGATFDRPPPKVEDEQVRDPGATGSSARRRGQPSAGHRTEAG